VAALGQGGYCEKLCGYRRRWLWVVVVGYVRLVLGFWFMVILTTIACSKEWMRCVSGLLMGVGIVGVWVVMRAERGKAGYFSDH